MYRLLTFLLLTFYANCSYLVASEEFEERPLSAILIDSYQEDPIIPSQIPSIGRYTPAYDNKKVSEIAEISVYDEHSPKYVSLKAEDGIFEFIEKEEAEFRITNEKTDFLQETQKIAELAEFDNGRMDKVKSHQIQTAPYKFFGNILITFPHALNKRTSPVRCVGSGVLIGPNHVLTAGHNIYNHGRGGWAQEIIFTPAQHKEYKPYGEAKGVILRTFKGWIQGSGEGYDYDIGLIILETAIGYQTGWMSLLEPEETFLDLRPTLTIAGYPYKDVKLKTQDGVTKVKVAKMYKHSAPLKESQEMRLLYEINTLEGQSGSPIISFIKSIKTSFVLGIHTHGSTAANEGARLTINKFERILEGISRFRLPRPSLEVSLRGHENEVEDYLIDVSKKAS
ncbi:MAG: hypothetical protein BGO76_01710 [Caedibacter sp. 38-128]|nr:trypsin-like serine protease [Holosporales bacterium]OJX05130.1 MAG: hypothetical protein BGO76_01710 [Caedibacter sp. 38-128]